MYIFDVYNRHLDRFCFKLMIFYIRSGKIDNKSFFFYEKSQKKYSQLTV